MQNNNHLSTKILTLAILLEATIKKALKLMRTGETHTDQPSETDIIVNRITLTMDVIIIVSVSIMVLDRITNYFFPLPNAPQPAPAPERNPVPVLAHTPKPVPTKKNNTHPLKKEKFKARKKTKPEKISSDMTLQTASVPPNESPQAHPNLETTQAPLPQADTDIQNKINALLNNEKFPLDERAAWVTLTITPYDDIVQTSEAHQSDVDIKKYLIDLQQIDALLMDEKSTLAQHRKRYKALINDYDKTPNISNEALTTTLKNIKQMQKASERLLANMTRNINTFNTLHKKITDRLDALQQMQNQLKESEAARKQRSLHMKALKQQKKAEKAELATRKTREAEAVDRLAAERAAEEDSRTTNVVLNRWGKSKDDAINNALFYAHSALLCLNDIASIDTDDSCCVRDICILSNIQLYQALSQLSETLFQHLLPPFDELNRHLTVFLHHALYAELPTRDWSKIAHDAHQHFFAFVDAYHEPDPSTAGKPMAAHTLPLLPEALWLSNEPSADMKLTALKNRCKNYLNLHKLLMKINPIENMDEVSPIIIAMQSAMMQIKQLGEAIGLTATNRHMQRVLWLNYEATYHTSPVNLGALSQAASHIKKLANTINTPNQVGVPSEVGMYRPTKTPNKQPATAPVPKPGF